MKKLTIILSIIIGILVIAIIACGVKIHKKDIRIKNLEKAKIERNIKSMVNFNDNNGIKIDGMNFKSLNYNIINEGNTKEANITYTLEGKDQKQQTLKNIKLENKDGKWIVDPSSKLTANQVNIVEKLVNGQEKETKEVNEKIENAMKKENQYMDNVQKQMNKQIAQMNKEFNNAFNN